MGKIYLNGTPYGISESGVRDVQVNGSSVVDSNKVANINIVHLDTEENWNSQISLVSQAGHIYVYTDHTQIDGRDIPAIKIGDGNAYLIDMPFVNEDAEAFLAHINNTVVHVGATERPYWNDKVTCYISETDNENVVFTKN